MTELISDFDRSVESDKMDASGSVGSQPAQDRRRLFRKLLALAGLGITGVLLSQPKTLFPAVQATPGGTDGGAVIINPTSINTSVGPTELDTTGVDTVAFSGVAKGSGFTVGLYGESTTSGVGYGVKGFVPSPTGVTVGVFGDSMSTSGAGVEGIAEANGGIGVLGAASNDGAIPLVARANSSGTQAANLQQWQNSSFSPLSVVDANGNIGVGTAAPQSRLFVVDSTTNPSRGIVASQNNSGAQAALMQMTKSRGTQTSPSAVVNGDYVAAFNMNAFDGTSYLGGKPMAGWGTKVNGTVSTGSIPADLFFYTKASGTLDPYGDGVVRVVISSAGNVGIGTTSPSHLIQLSGGAYSDGSTWVNASDRNLKENFTTLDENEILNRLESVPIQKWNYKNEPQAAHVGPVAQDFYAAYQLGDSDKSIGTVDAEGIAFAAIKALHKTMKELRTENEKIPVLMQAMKEQQERIAVLERTVKQLAAS